MKWTYSATGALDTEHDLTDTEEGDEPFARLDIDRGDGKEIDVAVIGHVDGHLSVVITGSTAVDVRYSYEPDRD